MRREKGKKRKAKSWETLSSTVLSFALLAFGFAVSAQAGVLPTTASLIPPETTLLVEVGNFSQLKSQFEKTNLYKLYKDPAMAAFVDDAKAKWRKKIQELDENDIFKTIFKADVLPQGRVAVALVFNEQSKDANETSVVVITQWGEKIDKVKEAVKKMLEKNAELGGHRKASEDYRGVRIETVIDETSSVLNYCFIDDCFIFTANPDVLKFIIAHIKGASSPTLASDTDYTSVIGATGPYHDIDLYINIKQIIKTIVAQDAAGKARTTITNLGLDNIASVGGSIGLGRRPGSSICGKAFLKINGAKKGVCKMFEVESAVIKAPRFIPSSAYSVTFLNLNIRKAYDELYNILYSFNPMTAAIMHVPLLPPSPDGEPGVQLKSDIVDHLGSQIVIAHKINKPFSGGSTPTESLVAVGVVNRRALEKSLSLLHSKIIAGNNPNARRELLGYTIYLVDFSAMLPAFLPGGRTPMQGPVELSTLEMPKLAFSVTDTHLIFGVESTVEQAIRTLSSTEATSVGSAKWFNNAKLAIPSVVGLACLENTAASSEFFWRIIKEGSKVSGSTILPGPASFQLGPDGVGELVNGSLLPEFDTVRKYFGSATFYGISRPDGFFFEFNYLNPASTD